ncbi:MAG: hypothetical protein M3072_17305 [Candidatus Dormibacteraeota bacterium]|nr:hypothetical protein [Candidatus Dormibacteraeota bacterium]
MAPRYRFPAFFDAEEGFGSPAAWWDVGWDEGLITHSARLEADREGEDPDLFDAER